MRGHTGTPGSVVEGRIRGVEESFGGSYGKGVFKKILVDQVLSRRIIKKGKY